MLLSLVLACGGWKKHVREGDDWMDRDNPGAAARSYDRAVDAREDDPELRLKLAQALLADGELEDSLEHSALALEFEVEGARRNRAQALLGLGRADEALELLKRESVGSDDPEVQYLMAEAELVRGDLTAAAHWLREARQTSSAPEIVGAHAYVAARLGDASVVGSSMAEARGWERPTPGAPADLAAAWLVLGQPGGASGAAELVLAAEPGARSPGGSREAWMEDAARYAGTQNWEAAIRAGLRANALTSDEGELHWHLATWFASTGDWKGATTWARSSLDLEPYYMPEAGSRVAAVKAGSALSAEERSAARAEIAALLMQGHRALGDTAAELEAVHLGLASGTEDNALLIRAAELLILEGRPKEATRAAMEAHRQGADDAARLAAIAFRDDGDLENAVGWASQAWEQKPGDPDVALLLAGMHSDDMRFEAALSVLQMAIGLNPDHRGLQAARADIVNRAN